MGRDKLVREMMSSAARKNINIIYEEADEILSDIQAAIEVEEKAPLAREKYNSMLSTLRAFLADKGQYVASEAWDYAAERTYLCILDSNDRPTKSQTDVSDVSEQVNHPAHYQAGKFECIQVMMQVFGLEAVRNFCQLNAFKYIWRSNQKGGYEDVEKAIWYLKKKQELSRMVMEAKD